MTFYNEKISIAKDRLDNIYIFQSKDRKIIYDYYNNITKDTIEKKITSDALEEYDIAIGEDGYIYLVYQNNYRDLFLTIISEEEIDSICLTVEPIPYVYDLTLILDGGEIHIFYNILLSEKDKKYRLYHHYYDNYNWYTNTIDEIKVSKILNFFNIDYLEDEIAIIYYDFSNVENIYMKKFINGDGKWSDRIKITNNDEEKLYMDSILVNNILHLTYSQYIEKNLVIKYERFNIYGDEVVMEKEMALSNVENCSYPTFVYFENKLWLIWLEYENILSRYSEDGGENWSPIYLWRESKEVDTVRYKYCEYLDEKNKKNFNYYFGKIYPEISFIGFGSLENTTEIPLKKKGSNVIYQF